MRRSLVLNPHLTYLGDEQEEKVIGFSCPVKGRGFIVTRFKNQSHLLGKAIALVRSQGRSISKLSEKDRETLHALGVLIYRKERSSRIRYRCDLEFYAKKISAGSVRFYSSDDFILNPSVIYRKNGGVPPFFSGKFSLPDELDCSGPTLWAEDPYTKITYPFFIHGGIQKTFENFCLRRKSGSYPAAHIEVLQLSRALLTKEDLRKAGDSLREIATKLSSKMRKEKHLRLQFLVHPMHVRSFHEYSQRLLQEGWLMPPTDKIRLRMTRHNDPIAEFFHQQMGPVISNVMNAEYKPSFSFVAIHHGGSRFKRHVDRSQCDLVCSLLVDYSPERPVQQAWPLYLMLRRNDHRSYRKAVRLRIGETLAFRGHTVKHYRPPLPQNHSSSHILFCFVSKNFTGLVD
jgi:hypothetical protein